MEAYSGSTSEGRNRAVSRIRLAPPIRVGASYRNKVMHVATYSCAVALGFAMGLVFRGTENLALLEWVMVLVAIAAMAAGYCIRGIELDGDEDPRRREAQCAVHSRSTSDGNRMRRHSESAIVPKRQPRRPVVLQRSPTPGPERRPARSDSRRAGD